MVSIINNNERKYNLIKIIHNDNEYIIHPTMIMYRKTSTSQTCLIRFKEQSDYNIIKNLICNGIFELHIYYIDDIWLMYDVITASMNDHNGLYGQSELQVRHIETNIEMEESVEAELTSWIKANHDRNNDI
jgi:hypothetical protein